ncbi:hypothetical protein JOF53_003872 [Crossiella equi]|uniref:Uncharacterized protein n=1 Tax=Crossiella equi TaxID=130796 RepID=A0ABS5AH49_9PSEU|nr:hypothetical protein [Crossiella equi]MBP2475000.1 hypothetical protein [Crossiella equi]
MKTKVKASLVAFGALAGVLTMTGQALAAPDTASRNGHTITASEATAIAKNGQEITVTGTGYETSKGYYVALCKVPDDLSYGVKPGPCQGGDGQGGTGVGPSAWVTNTPMGGNTYPIAANGSFSAKIFVKENAGGLDCTVNTCAIITRRDHWQASDRSYDVFIPVTFS